MGKIIKFPVKGAEAHQIERLKQFSDDIDQLALDLMGEEGVQPRDVAGILAHRLGSLMRHMEHKDRIWGVCEQVLKKQAYLDESS